MLQFFSFGSGSCGNSYYVSCGTDAVLVDAGVGIRRLKRDVRTYGLDMGILHGLLITHDHADHIKAAGYVSNDYNLKVYTTQAIHEGMQHNYHTLRKVDKSRDVNVEPDKTFTIGSLHITPFTLPHDSTANVGYSIEADGEVLTIMTDVGAPVENVHHYVAKSNYLVIEANYDREMLEHGSYPACLKQRITSGTGHLCNEQTAEVLVQNIHEGLRHVWLCHLSEENNHPELARKTVEMRLRSYGIIAGKDFQLDVLKRATSTGPWALGKDEAASRKDNAVSVGSEAVSEKDNAEDAPQWKAALFDLDGTLIDTEPQYSKFWGDTGRKYRPDVPRLAQEIKGTTLTQILTRYFPTPQIQSDIVDALDAWERQMRYDFLPGAREFVKQLRQHGIKCAVVTSSDTKKMANVRRSNPDFDMLFDDVLTAEDFSASKPDPDCYLKGAARLGATVEECVVFEDAITGITAGNNAHMPVVGLATTLERAVVEQHCEVAIDKFGDIDYEAVKDIHRDFNKRG